MTDISPEYLIILYSKYSPQCQKIMQVYDAERMSYFKMVCIDNAATRARLAQSKTVKITTVPCVLLVYPGNKMEKFEGTGVSEWILRQIAQNLPESKTTIEDSYAPPVAVKNEPKKEIAGKLYDEAPPQKTMISMLDDDQEIEEEVVEFVSSKPTTKKSIVEIAADLQSERPDLDADANRRKNYTQNR